MNTIHVVSEGTHYRLSNRGYTSRKPFFKMFCTKDFLVEWKALISCLILLGNITCIIYGKVFQSNESYEEILSG